MHLFLKAASWRVIATASMLVTGLYSLWLYGTYLEPAQYGVMALALTIMTYLPLLDGGFRTVINRALLSSAEVTKRDELLRFGQKLYSLLAAGILFGSLGLMAIYAWMPDTREQNIPFSLLLLYGLTNGLLAFSGIQSAVFVGLQQQSKIFVLQTLAVWSSVITLSWAFGQNWGLWALVAASLAGFLAMYPLCVFWLRKGNPELRIVDLSLGTTFREHFNALKSEAGYCFRTQLVMLVLYSADILIIGYFSASAEVAVYYVLIRLINMLRSFLQTGGEVGWPFFARRGGAEREDAIGWFGLHGWVYGAVAGALTIVTIPFCRWYLGSDWTAEAPLLWAVVVRFLVVGLGSSATYLLYSTGHFRAITRCLEAELAASVLFALIGAYFAGTLGVAVGFLMGTVFGTFIPVYVAYARHGTASFTEVFTTAWSRAILGFAVSSATAALLIKTLKQGFLAPVVASGAVAAALLAALALATARTGFNGSFGPRQLRQLLRKV